MNNIFDESFVRNQLNTIGAAPLLNLVRKGYGARLSHEVFLSKFQPHISNNAVKNKSSFIRDVLYLIGCNTTAYILKENQVIFRPKTENVVNLLLNLNEDDAKKIAKEANDKFVIRQRHVFWIFSVCLGTSNYQCNLYYI